MQVRHALFYHAGIQVNFGKTKVWNRAAENPTNITEMMLEKAKDLMKRDVWCCSECPLHTKFSCSSGLPTRSCHLQLLSRIPAVQDAQCAWLLLLMCAGPRRTIHSLQLVCHLQRCSISARTMTTSLFCRHHHHASPRWGHDRGGASCLSSRSVTSRRP